MQNKCPGCGASLELDIGLISIVCPYCKTISLVERGNLTSNGEKSFIMPFPTIFSVGKYFYAVESNNSNDKIQNKSVNYLSEQEYNEIKKENFVAKLYVYGQIRYTNDGGFWDDFFVRIIDDKIGLDKSKEYIIGENEGLINLYCVKKIHTDADQNIFEMSVGNTWNGYFIQETGKTNIEGFNGTFPFFISSNDNSKYINLLKDGKPTQLKSIGNDIIEYNGI